MTPTAEHMSKEIVELREQVCKLEKDCELWKYRCLESEALNARLMRHVRRG